MTDIEKIKALEPVARLAEDLGLELVAADEESARLMRLRRELARKEDER